MGWVSRRFNSGYPDFLFFMETIKNFFALCISTITWSAGLATIFGILLAIATFDLFALIFSLIPLLIMGLGILIGKYNIRVKTALEFPFGFLLS